jgi:hypothetical protein
MMLTNPSHVARSPRAASSSLVSAVALGGSSLMPLAVHDGYGDASLICADVRPATTAAMPVLP